LNDNRQCPLLEEAGGYGNAAFLPLLNELQTETGEGPGQRPMTQLGSRIELSAA
jgi:hypothetical protein